MSLLKTSAIGLLLISSPLMADSLTLTLEISGSDYFTKDKKVLKGSQSIFDGKVSLVGNLAGESLNFSQDIPSQKDKNKTDLILKSKNSVQIVSKEHSIDGEAQAEVDTSVFGKLKGLKIKERDYLAVMQPILEESGYNQLKALELTTDELNFSTRITSSDYSCIALSRSEVKCDSNVVIEISISTQPQLSVRNCHFSSSSAAQYYTRAMAGNTSVISYLSEQDLNQDPSCSASIAQALEDGHSVADIVNAL